MAKNRKRLDRGKIIVVEFYRTCQLPVEQIRTFVFVRPLKLALLKKGETNENKNRF